MANQTPKVSPRNLALRFISGKYQGGEFPLAGNQEIFVGRSSDLDMVLVEDMVSRRHARIACTDEQILIEDLGSTNGTFVNGEKIKKTALKEGDRVAARGNFLLDSQFQIEGRESLFNASPATTATTTPAPAGHAGH